MEDHLNRYGRTRLIHPIYIALAKNGSDAGLADELFASARNQYHPLTIIRIEDGLNALKE